MTINFQNPSHCMLLALFILILLIVGWCGGGAKFEENEDGLPYFFNFVGFAVIAAGLGLMAVLGISLFQLIQQNI